MNLLRSIYFRVGVSIAAILFFLLVIVIGALVYQNQKVLEHKLRENMIWGVYQYDREVRELRINVIMEKSSSAQYSFNSHDDLLLRTDILFSRVKLLQSGEMGRMLRALPKLHAQLMTSLPHVDALDKGVQALIEDKGQHERLMDDLLTQLNSLQELTSRLLLDINAAAAIQRTKERDELLSLYALALMLLLLLTLSGAVLVVALIVEARGHASKARMLEERTHELDDMVTLAQDASRAKSEFMAIMSHEIRTPLNGIVGVADLIGEDVTSGRGRESIEILRQSAESLQVVINDVLDYSKIEAGKLTLDSRSFSLSDFLDALCAYYFHQCDGGAEPRSRIFIEDRASDLPSWVEGDINRLRQVLTNLLNNAFKFCPQGTIRLGVSRHEDGVLRFEVQDSGCGIDPEQIGHLFEPFTQVDTSMARRHEGAGLGLAISKRLVEAMQGEIGVQSHLGLGSRFWCTIPLSFVSAAQACHEEAMPVSLPKARILVVEDNVINQSLVREMLGLLGQQVSIVDDGQQALAWLTRDGVQVDLVFMDMQMPILDGVETTYRWRQHEAEMRCISRLPIVAMTANVMQEDAQRCLEAGMDGVLHKPFRREDLRRVLMQHLSGLTISQEAIPEITQSVTGNVKLVHSASGVVMPDISGDTAHDEVASTLLQVDMCQELLSTLQAECYSKLLANYLVRLEERIQQMHKLHAEGEYELLKREAHSLKGASGALGCQGIACTAETLEGISISDNEKMICQQLSILSRLKLTTRDALIMMNFLLDKNC